MTAPKRLVFSPSAIRDLEEMLAWYGGQQVPEAVHRLLEEIIRDIENLLRHPDMGSIVPEFGVVNLRELIRPPFRIVYRREKTELPVVRVWRSERILKIPPREKP